VLTKPEIVNKRATAQAGQKPLDYKTESARY